MGRSIFRGILVGLYEGINRRVPWWKLPSWLGIPNLLAYRIRLREENLHDTWTPGSLRRHPGPPPDPDLRRYRTPDGSWNDLEYPDMGAAGTRFGRNAPLSSSWPEGEPDLLEPSPREVSRRLMTREEFVPATTLNVLAAAWIQFQTHDWFDHGQAGPAHDDFRLDLEDDDDWPACPMRIPRTPPDPTRTVEDEGRPPTFVNRESHWWDASCIYGSSVEKTRRCRAGESGKLAVEGDGRLPVDPGTGRVATGFNDNWWVGLDLLHTIFTHEHNAICDELARAHPEWDDERLFQTARLVNVALMAKIHTVEWTPAITDHPTLHVAMNANWSGIAADPLKRLLGPLGRSELFGGIPGTPQNHHGAPFQLTEEFVSVYRLHPLIPDVIELRGLGGGPPRVIPFEEVALGRAVGFMERLGLSREDLWYSLGVAHPGAVCLHNFPAFLQDFTRPDGTRLDLAAVDVLRDRERGVPRYNEFRRMLGMRPARTFQELTDDPEWAEEIEDVYGGDIERVDLMVGMFAETPPPGFGFSDTAFRVFILMASRRLGSDRFFTSDFRPEIYSEEGIRWVRHNGMRSVLLRHHPELEPALEGVANPFAPWRIVHRSWDPAPTAEAVGADSSITPHESGA